MPAATVHPKAIGLVQGDQLVSSPRRSIFGRRLADRRPRCPCCCSYSRPSEVKSAPVKNDTENIDDSDVLSACSSSSAESVAPGEETKETFEPRILRPRKPRAAMSPYSQRKHSPRRGRPMGRPCHGVSVQASGHGLETTTFQKNLAEKVEENILDITKSPCQTENSETKQENACSYNLRNPRRASYHAKQSPKSLSLSPVYPIESSISVDESTSQSGSTNSVVEYQSTSPISFESQVSDSSNESVPIVPLLPPPPPLPATPKAPKRPSNSWLTFTAKRIVNERMRMRSPVQRDNVFQPVNRLYSIRAVRKSVEQPSPRGSSGNSLISRVPPPHLHSKSSNFSGKSPKRKRVEDEWWSSPPQPKTLPNVHDVFDDVCRRAPAPDLFICEEDLFSPSLSLVVSNVALPSRLPSLGEEKLAAAVIDSLTQNPFQHSWERTSWLTRDSFLGDVCDGECRKRPGRPQARFCARRQTINKAASSSSSSSVITEPCIDEDEEEKLDNRCLNRHEMFVVW